MAINADWVVEIHEHLNKFFYDSSVGVWSLSSDANIKALGVNIEEA